jgi:hypothetical protein
LTVKIPGTYQLNINDGFCDGNSNAIEVIVNGVSGISSLNNLSLKYYPNPVNDNLTVELGALHFNQYQVLNLQGMEVISAIGDFTGNITIPMKGLFQGFYLLKISGNNEVVIKILKD